MEHNELKIFERLTCSSELKKEKAMKNLLASHVSLISGQVELRGKTPQILVLCTSGSVQPGAAQPGAVRLARSKNPRTELSKLIAMASNLLVMASNLTSNGLQPNSDGLRPTSKRNLGEVGLDHTYEVTSPSSP